MAFEKSYKEFCDDMESAKIIMEMIEDDFIVDMVLKIAHEATVKRINKKYAHDPDKQWDYLKRHKDFNYHFTWEENPLFGDVFKTGWMELTYAARDHMIGTKPEDNKQLMKFFNFIPA